MKQIKRIVALTICIMLVGFGAAVSLKAAIGVGAWDALAQSFSFLTGLKVGTVGMLFNSSCVLGQIIILKREFKWSQLLQVAVSILLGTVVNFFLYGILDTFVIESYLLNLVLLVVALVIIAFAVGSVMVLDVVTLAVEGLCMAISRMTGKGFSKVRQWADILFIIVILALTFGFSLPPTLREGTVISMLIFAPMMGFFMDKMRPVYQRLDLLVEVPVTAEEEEQLEIV